MRNDESSFTHSEQEGAVVFLLNFGVTKTIASDTSRS